MKGNLLLLKDLLEPKEQNLQIHDYGIKKVYIDKLDYAVNKYNTYHSTNKMKPIDVKSSKYIGFVTKNNDPKLDPKFEVSDHVRISKYKEIFAKDYTPNWSEKVFVIKKFENTVPWIYVIEPINREQTASAFYEKLEFRAEKVIKRKGDELYVKWKE